MLQITKQGNSIVVKGLDHALYPYSGTLEIPCNSVITVVDESDIVTFRSASNYDVLFSGLVTDITINGESVTKENVGDKFGALSNVNSGGLTPEQEEKLNNSVQIANYNADKVAQATIDENQNSAIEGLRGNIEGKQDKIDDLNTIREGAEKGATALQTETDPIWTAEKGNYYTKSEVNSSLESKADKSEIPSLDGYATEQWVGQQGYITEETDPTVPSHVKAITEEDIAKWNQGGYDVYQWSFYPYSYAKENVGFTFTKNGSTITGPQGYKVNYKRYSKTGGIDGIYQTVSAESFLFEIPLTDDTIFIVASLKEGSYTRLEFSFDVVSNIKGGGITEETDPVWTAEKVNYYTKTEVNTSLDTKANKTEIPTVPTNVSEFTNDAGYLTQHQTLKTINGETIVGDGNIEITSGEETDPIWTAEKVNYYTKTEVDAMIGNINNALATLING